ncbi:cytochrome c oxidase assembly factor CtaG [Salicibibacter halophilus]|uniref:Cytochrome c oxidase assembly factor CtaG n=1 Tax=Salicibibacter halophilus TaxID=2502791 RepID=A0A514LGH6_9BACI|nr:cytochrome c oxidase assembly factor CtaG [Salicibibacter halophilus]QDI90954.1 cytochrome c oxidase assembly factor CtaG [Salicibibacter halophilus]
MEDLFDQLTFRALWTPELIVVLAVVAILYVLLTRKWYVRFEGGTKPQLKHDFMFGLALLFLYLGWGSPLYSTGHMTITLHMLQMVCAYFFSVPLMIIALPKWFLSAAYEGFGNYARMARNFMFHPIVGLIMFNALFSFYHIPVVFDFLMLRPGVHSLYEIAMFIAAWMMWWHIIAPLPKEQYLHDFRRILYIFGNGILITPACALIIFSGYPLYDTYTDMQYWASVMAYCLPANASVSSSMFGGMGFLGSLDAYSDQQLAGILMKVVQEIVYGTAIGITFKQWLQKDSHQDSGEPSISDIPENVKMGDR